MEPRFTIGSFPSDYNSLNFYGLFLKGNETIQQVSALVLIPLNPHVNLIRKFHVTKKNSIISFLTSLTSNLIEQEEDKRNGPDT